MILILGTGWSARGEEREIHVQAHRGASALVMENTIPAFLKAIELGANSVELDVSVTRDGQVVVFHNFGVGPETVRRADGPVSAAWVHSHTLAELQKMELLLKQRLTVEDVLTPDQKRMPSLIEVFKAVEQSPLPGARTVVLDVELKSEPGRREYGPAPEEYARIVLDVIRKHGPAGRVAVRSFDHELLEAVRAQEPGLPLVALTQEGYLGFDGDYVAVMKKLGTRVLAPFIGDLTRDKVERIRREGGKTIPWSKKDQPKAWGKVLKLGVDGITADDPGKLIRYAGERGLSPSRDNLELFRCGTALSKIGQ